MKVVISSEARNLLLNYDLAVKKTEIEFEPGEVRNLLSN